VQLRDVPAWPVFFDRDLVRPVSGRRASPTTLKTWANELGYNDAVKLLDATLTEEKNTDISLSQLAESEVNKHAETAQAA
jgi:hypothetical protein